MDRALFGWKRWVKQMDWRPLVFKFIPDGQEVFNLLIHTLSLIFLKMGSSFRHLSMIMTNKFGSVWPSLVKWATTGDSSMRLWAMLNWWLLNQQPSFQHHPQSHKQIPCGSPFYQQGPYKGRFIGRDHWQMLEGGCHLDNNQREQMDKDVEDLLAVGDEFKNRRSLVHLLYSPFLTEQSPIQN